MMIVGGLTGINSGPLIEFALAIDPSIVTTAVCGTAVVFISLSICALVSSDGYWLAFGGMLLSGLFWLLFLLVLTIVFQSEMLFNIYLHVGLVIFCGLVLYDTQFVVARFKAGDDDYIGHSLNLFLDVLNLFKIILILLLLTSGNRTDGAHNGRRRDSRRDRNTRRRSRHR
jgi:FtsH-binding integral membrane protein